MSFYDDPRHELPVLAKVEHDFPLLAANVAKFCRHCVQPVVETMSHNISFSRDTGEKDAVTAHWFDRAISRHFWAHMQHRKRLRQGHVLQAVDHVWQAHIRSRGVDVGNQLGCITILERYGFEFPSFSDTLFVIAELHKRLTPPIDSPDRDSAEKAFMQRVGDVCRQFVSHVGCLDERTAESYLLQPKTFLSGVRVFELGGGDIAPCKAVTVAGHAMRQQIDLETLLPFLTVYGINRIDDVIDLLGKRELDRRLVQELAATPDILVRAPSLDALRGLLKRRERAGRRTTLAQCLTTHS